MADRPSPTPGACLTQAGMLRWKPHEVYATAWKEAVTAPARQEAARNSAAGGGGGGGEQGQHASSAISSVLSTPRSLWTWATGQSGNGGGSKQA